MHRITTPYGDAGVRLVPIGRGEVVMLARHGFDHGVAPHNINHRAHIWALHHLGVRRVMSTAAAGSLREDYGPGTLVILSDFVDFRGGAPVTFFEGGADSRVIHTDFTEPFCNELRRLIYTQLAADDSVSDVGDDKLKREGTYLCLSGPRYETPAEVRLFSRLGMDVVGMTVASEAILARELGMCYASVAVVTNLGSGLSSHPLSHNEVETEFALQRPRLARAFMSIAQRLLVTG